MPYFSKNVNEIVHKLTTICHEFSHYLQMNTQRENDTFENHILERRDYSVWGHKKACFPQIAYYAFQVESNILIV